MDWQINDIAVCMVDLWFDHDGYPLIGFPRSGPDLGEMTTVAAMRRHPEYGSLDLRFSNWPDAWFDAAAFRRIPPPVRNRTRQARLPA